MDTIIPAEMEPQPVPEQHNGRRIIRNPLFPSRVDSDVDVELYFNTQRIRDLAANNPDTAAKVAFEMLHHTRLSDLALERLRKDYLPSFSAMKWKHIRPYFYHNLQHGSSSHMDIPPYILKRCRVPIELFESIVRQMDVANQVLGQRRWHLETEAAIQLHWHPVPLTLLSLFRDRLNNMPGTTLRGQISGSGRCEFTLCFNGRMMLLFIECEDNFIGSISSWNGLFTLHGLNIICCVSSEYRYPLLSSHSSRLLLDASSTRPLSEPLC